MKFDHLLKKKKKTLRLRDLELTQADYKRLDSFHLRCQRRILHISWHDFVSNNEALHHSTLFDVSYTPVNEDWVSLVTSPDFEVMHRQTRFSKSVSRRETVIGFRESGDAPAVVHPPPGSIRSAVTRVLQRRKEAVELAKDKPFWRTIATAGRFG